MFIEHLQTLLSSIFDYEIQSKTYLPQRWQINLKNKISTDIWAKDADNSQKRA